MERGTLHDEDVYAWCYEQAAVLRRMAETRRDLPNELDIENLCEEIEGLARTDLREAESHLRLVLLHLLKLATAAHALPGRHWRTELGVFQAGFETMATRTILRKLRVDRMWRLAREQAAEQLEAGGDAILPGLPSACPLSPGELIGDPFDLEGALARILRSAAGPQPLA